MRKEFVVLVLGFAITAATASFARQKNSLVGTWRLVSESSSTDNGEINKTALGENPAGFITYTAEGRMMAIISQGGGKPLSVADRVSAPADERAEAFSTFNAYAGRYTVAGDKVIHHVEIASMQNLVNTDLVRYAKIQGDHLTLRTPPETRGGKLQTMELVWERVK